ncbi:MAG: nuclear export factor [Ilumatobacteraceae bacterium]|nr:nuclear export factor [Ilumatobacteraceae bacterium]
MLLGAGIASAHIEADPPAVQAGTKATVSFAVEHGCNGSNTTKLEFKAPADVTDAQAVDKTGWTTGAANGTVSFTGGNLDASTPDDFSITFTAPTTAGVIHFPVVQTCAVGETAWIEIAADGAAEPEHPAPAVLVTDGPPTSAQLAPAKDDGADPASSTGGGGSSNTGVIVGIAIGAVVVIGGAVLLANRRKGSAPSL